MKPIQTITSLLTLVSAIFLLTACGGGSSDSTSLTGPTYTGLTTAVDIDDTNAEAIGVAATDALENALTQDAANSANPYSPTGITTETYTSDATNTSDLAINLYNQLKNLENLPSGLTIPYTDLGDPNYCGGSVSIPDSMLSSSTFNGTIQLINLCYNDPSIGQVTINGAITFSETTSEISIISNITISYNGITQTANAGISCSLDIDGFITSCSVFSNYVGNDGQVYRIADVTLIENFDTSVHFEATYYHPDHGQMDIITNPDVTFGVCANGKPDSGTINFTSTNGTYGEITFRSDCTGYDGSYYDGVASGTFSANWL